MHASAQDRSGIAAALSQMAEGLSRLFAQHLQLAKLELLEDARATGGQLARMAVFLPLVLVGYLFVCAALAAALAGALSVPGALLLVGLVNLVGGAAGLAVAARRLKGRRVMDDTLRSVSESAHLLRDGRGGLEAPHDA